jgi:hypothetical protein
MVKSSLKFVYFEQKGESLTNYNLVAIREVSSKGGAYAYEAYEAK